MRYPVYVLAVVLFLQALPCSGQRIRSWADSDGSLSSLRDASSDDEDQMDFNQWQAHRLQKPLTESQRKAELLRLIKANRAAKEAQRIADSVAAARLLLAAADSAKVVELPHSYDENGVDMMMLTFEGVDFYMKRLSPVYLQEITEDVLQWVKFFAFERRDYTERVFRRFAQWRPYIVDTFGDYGVPAELAELCIVESGCTFRAKSSVGAVGMWQIMPDTGDGYGMTIDPITDEREDPVKATVVAAKILRDNMRSLGDWTLAAAAYNCGAGRVSSDLRRSAGKAWADVVRFLPQETRRYIPQLLAAHYVGSYRTELGFKDSY